MIFVSIDTGVSRCFAKKPRSPVSCAPSALAALFIRPPRARRLIRHLPDYRSTSASRLESGTSQNSVTPTLHYSAF